MEGKNIINPDFLSLCTHQIAIGFSETEAIFSTASSFLYSFENRMFLITNWHNVTGRNPLTGETLSSHGGVPDTIITLFRILNGGGKCEAQTINLYEDKEMTKPRWLVHPQYKEQVDVVALEIFKSDKYIYSAVNKANFDEINPEVGDECFVIGYPFDEFRYLGLPIWKKASIATEPTVNEDQLPKILIDTATRSGLSGSPVIYQRSGIHNMLNNVLADDTIIGTIRGLLGVYSGRIGKGEIHAQLGIVWKAKVIDEIINGNCKGDIEFQKGNNKNSL